MDERSPKRRRTSGSPTTDGQQQRRTPRRASYMSPTKASLARFNPSLLKSPHLSKSPIRPLSRRTTFAPAQADLTDVDASSVPPIAPAEDRALPVEGLGDNAHRTDNLFDDLNLDSSKARTADVRADEAIASLPEDGTHPVKGPQIDIGQEGDLAAKAREKEELQQELSILKRSCRQIEQFLDRTRAAKDQDGMDDAAMHKLATLLHDADGAQGEPEAQPMSALLDSLLPFSNPVKVDDRTEDEEFHVPSHRPLELKDPLPCLQLFTSMRCSLHAEPPRTGKDIKGGVVTLQEQHLWIRDATRLFSSRIDFEVSTSSDEETVPQVTKLSASHFSAWARGELHSWIKEREEDRDLGCLTYGLGSYFEMSLKRAQVWQKCEQHYTSLCQDIRKERKENLDLEVTSKARNEVASIPELCRTTLSLQDREVLLQVEWAIQLDWTGEARSTVTARAAFAQPYNDLDNRKSLPKVPATFARLVRDRGVFAAISAMASVLFS